jgi:diguanylate cyclase (GGDEF)-like protein/PAS domain S-box-containing protein
MAEAQVAEEKERLRVTLDSIGEGVISTDAEGRVRFMNPVAEVLTGWDESHAIGRALPEVFATKYEATGASAPDVTAACLASVGAREIDNDVILADRNGNARGVSGTASPVQDASGGTIGAVLVFKDVTSFQEAQRQLTHSANHDALTGLPNRSALARALSEASRAAGLGQRTSALCFIDLDRFKPVNDTAGHAAGDQLLQIVARVIRASCGAHDFAARLGGDEFVVLLDDCPIANAEQVARKIVDAVAAIDFEWNGKHYSIGASVGVAAVGPGSADDALARADAACYAAKTGGRGRVVSTGV